jgi:hypothetical protein
MLRKRADTKFSQEPTMCYKQLIKQRKWPKIETHTFFLFLDNHVHNIGTTKQIMLILYLNHLLIFII